MGTAHRERSLQTACRAPVTWERSLPLRIPIEHAYFYSCALHALLEGAEVRLPVVIRNDYFGMECLYGFGSFLGRHGIGQVHAHKRDIDILESAHFGDIFRIAGKINARPALGENVAVAAALIVIKLASLRAARKVLH